MNSQLPKSWAEYAGRSLPRYTSYPTAVSFQPAGGDAEPRAWLAGTRADQALSAYVHVPFCKRLCWYCGCHTSVVHNYGRVAAFHETLMAEIDLWAEALGPHGGLAHLHFGGGSPNALSPGDFVALARRLSESFGLGRGAEVAAELDPGTLSEAFIDAAGAAGVTRVSLGVQTFDAEVQVRVNRVQPFAMVADAVRRLRAAGVAAINFDLMYGLPGQTVQSVAETVDRALSLRPDRVAVFGYAHVPWMKKHQGMIDEAALSGAADRWNQAEAADRALVGAGYVRVGLDHYALPDDPLARAALDGRLRRNFQGYTDDPAPVLIPFGPSSIGQFPLGFVQNAAAADAWREAVRTGRLPVARTLTLTPDDRLRAAVIERLMCDLTADVGEVCVAQGFPPDALDTEIARAAARTTVGLAAVSGRTVRIPEAARRMMRVAAACFDAHLSPAPRRHALAV